jgi:hypothetical protein
MPAEEMTGDDGRARALTRFVRSGTQPLVKALYRAGKVVFQPDFDTLDIGSSTGVCRGFAEGSFQRSQSLFQAGKRGRRDLGVLVLTKYRVIYPPIHAHLFGFVNGADDQADLNGEQFDVNQLYPDIASDNDSLVQNALQDIRQGRRLNRMR